MSLTMATHGVGRQDAARRWGVSALAVLALHAGVAALLLRTVPLFEAPRTPPEAVLLDLPPEPEAAPEPQQGAPPDAAPTPAAADPEPATPPAIRMVEAAAAPTPLPEPPPPEPAAEPISPSPAPPIVPSTPPPPPPARAARPASPPRPAPPQVRAHAPAPVQSAQPSPAPVAIAPAAAPAPPPANPHAVPTWRGELIARLQKSKRYPDAARSRGDQGVAVVTFTMDRSGRILSAALARSSGVAALDDEAITMLHRAEPLPAMPPEMPAPSITLTLPVSFALR